MGAGIHCESLLQHTSEIGEKLPSERSQQGRHEATLSCHVFVEETRVLVVDDAQDGDVMLERAKPNLGLGATRERQLVHQIKELAESRRRWVSGRGAKASTVEREREGAVPHVGGVEQQRQRQGRLLHGGRRQVQDAHARAWILLTRRCKGT